MKKLIITVFAMAALVSCKKNSNNNTAPTLAVLSSSVTSEGAIKIDIRYTSANTTLYYDDIVKLYINDTFTDNTSLNPQGPNSEANYTFINTIAGINVDQFTGSHYRVDIVREITPGNKVTIASITAN